MFVKRSGKVFNNKECLLYSLFPFDYPLATSDCLNITRVYCYYNMFNILRLRCITINHTRA